MLQLLRTRREQVADALACLQDFGVAVCEVFDELIRRAQVIADQYPEDQAVTHTLIRESPAVMGALKAILSTVDTLTELMRECAEAMQARRDPVLRFVARVESEGINVADDWTLTDTHTCTPVDDPAEPDLLVQREAAQIARTERATAYHERLIRMADTFEQATIQCAQQVRGLIPSVLDG